MILLWRNAGNSIHIVKFRLCKSAEKNCSEAGSYYSGPACQTGIIRPARTAHGNVGEKRAGANMRSEHRQPSGTGSGYSGKAARAAKKGVEGTKKAQYHTISVPKPLFRHPTPAFLPLIHLMTTPPRDMSKHFSCYFQNFPSLMRYASCFWARAGAIAGGHAFQTPRSASRHNASCTLW